MSEPFIEETDYKPKIIIGRKRDLKIGNKR